MYSCDLKCFGLISYIQSLKKKTIIAGGMESMSITEVFGGNITYKCSNQNLVIGIIVISI